MRKDVLLGEIVGGTLLAGFIIWAELFRNVGHVVRFT